jgi:hypothetical protein
MYITGMRLLYLLLLFALMCGYGKEPAAGNTVVDSPKCKELFKLGIFSVAPETIKYLKTTSDMCEYGQDIIPCGIEGYETNVKCACIETIACNGENYCVSHKCPSYDKPIAIFDSVAVSLSFPVY